MNKPVSKPIVISEDEMESPISSVVPSAITLPSSIDKINNLVQKENNLSKAGVTRYKYMLVIAEALEATRWIDEPDEQGNIKRVLKPDVPRRQWGAEQAARLYGDMIERKEIEHDIGDKTLDRFRSLSVADLKARANEILQGSPSSPRLARRNDITDV